MFAMADLDPIVLFLSFSAALKYSLMYLWGSTDKVIEDVEYVGQVSQLFVHPIKSAHGLQPSQAECTPLGIKTSGLADRHFQVVSTHNGEVISANAKVTPVLASVTVSLDGDFLHLGAPNQESTKLNWKECVHGAGDEIIGSLHGVQTWGRDCGDQIARWFDGVIGKPGHRLIYADSSLQKRTIKNSTTRPPHLAWTKGAKPDDKIAYQDVTPYLIVNQSSLDLLNEKLQQPVEFTRFRPNIVVSGAPALDEDTWKTVIIGDARFSFIKRCNRCPQTTVDPSTGLRHPQQEPLRTLRTYRMNGVPEINSPTMGLNMAIEKPGEIKLGDPVYVIRGDTTILPK